MAFIDFHAHLHPTPLALEKLLKTMERLEVEKAVVVAGGVVAPTDLFGETKPSPVPNAEVRTLCEQSHGRLIPFYFVDPFASSQEYAREGHRFFGIKLGPAVHGVEILDSRYGRYLQLAEKFGHAVYLHCLPRPGFEVSALTQLSERHPSLTFILGHAGIGNCDFKAVQLIKEHSNIYFETSGGFSSVISFAIEQLGIERILFGTEYPLQSPEIELTKMRCLNINPEVLNENARRVLKEIA